MLEKFEMDVREVPQPSPTLLEVDRMEAEKEHVEGTTEKKVLRFGEKAEKLQTR